MLEELVHPPTSILTSEKRDTWHKRFTSLAIAQLNKFGEYFRGQINNTRHQGGSTMTSVGDMRTLGHRTAADDRVRNNGLEMEGLMPEGMSEDEQMRFAMMASKESGGQQKTEGLSEEQMIEIAMEENARDNSTLQLYQPPPRAKSAPPLSITPPLGAPAATVSTPDVLARTRSLSVKRRAQTDKSDGKTRRYLAKVTKGLSNPKDESMVNTVLAFQDDPTPDRLDELVDYLADLDEK